MLVSVLMLAYNHEMYLGQALDSVLTQRTNFDFEVWVGEDCSTDGTARVLASYAARYGVIKPIYREKNIGLKHNFVDTLSRCQGKYVAILAGDDYWIDTYKLQKQVDFLEEHPEYVLVCGNALVLFEDRSPRRIMLAKEYVDSFDFGTRDLMLGNPCIASTVMFRNGLVMEFPIEWYRSYSEDRRFWILVSLHGRCRYDNAVMSVYRIHGGGMVHCRKSSYKGRIGWLQDQIRDAEMWNRLLGGGYSHEVGKVRSHSAREIVKLALKHGDFKTILAYARWVDLEEVRSRRGLLMYRLLRWLSRTIGVWSVQPGNSVKGDTD